MAFSDDDIAAEFRRETRTEDGQLSAHLFRELAAGLIPLSSASGKTQMKRDRVDTRRGKEAERKYYFAIDNPSIAE